MRIPPEREPQSVPGDFYVEKNMCLACGIPHVVAPDLVGWVDDAERTHCYWKKQPETEQEMQQAFAIFDAQEAGCHRYAGHDQAIQERVGWGNCDYPTVSFFNLKPRTTPWPPPPFQFEQGPSLLARLWNALRRRR
jgi:hypothetical protein